MELADSINAVFQMTSAKSGVGINALFENLGRLYLDPDFDYKAQDRIDKENYEQKKLMEESKKNQESNMSVKITKKAKNNNKRRGCCG